MRTTTAAKKPPFIGQLGTTAAGGRLLKWAATGINKWVRLFEFGATGINKEWVSFWQFGTTGNWCEQQMGHFYWATDVNNYGREAAAFLNWATGINKCVSRNNNGQAAVFLIGSTGTNKWWLTIIQVGSGRFAFGQLQKLGSVTTSFDQKLFLILILFTPQHKIRQFYTTRSLRL